MIKKMLFQSRLFSILLTQVSSFVFFVKAVFIFTLKYVYFSNPAPLNATHLFSVVKSDISATDCIEESIIYIT